MKIAYLILAHNTPDHLSRLLEALDCENSRFFIHIDKKSDIRLFQESIISKRAVFIKKRVEIFWGEFSSIMATLNLIEESLKHEETIEYLCLISGSCYPIRSPQYIESFFINNDKTEFIETIEMPDPETNKSLDRIELYHINTFNKNIFIRKFCHILNYIMVKKKLFRRDSKKYLGNLRPYAGSSWWAITADAAKYILSFTAANPKFVSFFKNTVCSDESFFQTIIGNSKFSKNVKPSLTYTDWSIPGSASPAIIDTHHINVLKNLKHGEGEILFARKFTDDSLELTQAIDKEIIAVYGSQG
jgi:hypothetical protein